MSDITPPRCASPSGLKAGARCGRRPSWSVVELVLLDGVVQRDDRPRTSITAARPPSAATVELEQSGLVRDSTPTSVRAAARSSSGGSPGSRVSQQAHRLDREQERPVVRPRDQGLAPRRAGHRRLATRRRHGPAARWPRTTTTTGQERPGPPPGDEPAQAPDRPALACGPGARRPQIGSLGRSIDGVEEVAPRQRQLRSRPVSPFEAPGPGGHRGRARSRGDRAPPSCRPHALRWRRMRIPSTSSSSQSRSRGHARASASCASSTDLVVARERAGRRPGARSGPRTTGSSADVAPRKPRPAPAHRRRRATPAAAGGRAASAAPRRRCRA